jgi:hypothetical protein
MRPHRRIAAAQAKLTCISMGISLNKKVGKTCKIFSFLFRPSQMIERFIRNCFLSHRPKIPKFSKSMSYIVCPTYPFKSEQFQKPVIEGAIFKSARVHAGGRDMLYFSTTTVKPTGKAGHSRRGAG